MQRHKPSTAAAVVKELRETRKDAGMVVYIATKTVNHNLLAFGHRIQADIDRVIAMLEATDA